MATGIHGGGQTRRKKKGDDMCEKDSCLLIASFGVIF